MKLPLSSPYHSVSLMSRSSDCSSSGGPPSKSGRIPATMQRQAKAPYTGHTESHRQPWRGNLNSSEHDMVLLRYGTWSWGLPASTLQSDQCLPVEGLPDGHAMAALPTEPTFLAAMVQAWNLPMHMQNTSAHAFSHQQSMNSGAIYAINRRWKAIHRSPPDSLGGLPFLFLRNPFRSALLYSKQEPLTRVLPVAQLPTCRSPSEE